MLGSKHFAEIPALSQQLEKFDCRFEGVQESQQAECSSQPNFYLQIIRDPMITLVNELSSCLPAIGMLRSIWYDSTGKISCLAHGTAFAITSRIIVTCMHNIYSTTQSYCTEALFFPGLNRVELSQQTPFYKTAQNGYYKNNEVRSVSNTPVRQELALLFLEKNLPNKVFINLRTFQNIKKGTNLAIVGYPSEEYFDARQLSQITLKRNILSGTIYSINDYVIHHTIVETTIGNSGSPILAKNERGEFEVIGIHTHKSSSHLYKSGLFFTAEVLQTLNTFKRQLMREHNIQQIQASTSKIPVPLYHYSNYKDFFSQIEPSLRQQQEMISQISSLIWINQKDKTQINQNEGQIDHNEEDFVNSQILLGEDSDFESSSSDSSQQSLSFYQFGTDFLENQQEER